MVDVDRLYGMATVCLEMKKLRAIIQRRPLRPVKIRIHSRVTLSPPQIPCGRRKYLPISVAYGRRILAVEQM